MLTQETANFLFDGLSEGISESDPPETKSKVKKALLELAFILNTKNAKKSASVEGPDNLHQYLIGYDPNKKVSLIKWVRSVTGLGLKESKDLVETATYTAGFGMEGFKIQLVGSVFQTALPELEKIMPHWADLGPLETEKAPETVNVIERTVFLLLKKDSKTVKVFADAPSVGAGEVCIQTTVRVPDHLFDPVRIQANIDIPNDHTKLDEAVIDLQHAVSMSYGQKVELVIQPVEQDTLGL
jgi:hypothetical protein